MADKLVLPEWLRIEAERVAATYSVDILTAYLMVAGALDDNGRQQVVADMQRGIDGHLAVRRAMSPGAADAFFEWMDSAVTAIASEREAEEQPCQGLSHKPSMAGALSPRRLK